MKRAKLLILLLCLPFILLASTSPVVEKACSQMEKLVDQSSLDDALMQLNILDSLAAIYTDKESLAELYYHQAYYWISRRGETISFDFFSRAALLFRELNLNDKAMLTEAQICMNLYYLNRFEESFEKAYLILDTPKEQYPYAKAIAYNILAAMEGGANGNLPKSLEYAKLALPHLKSHNHYRRLISVYGILASYHNSRENPNEALLYIDTASMYAQKLENYEQLNFLKIRKARSYFNLGDGKSAVNSLLDAEKFYRNFGSEHGELPWIYGLLRNYYQSTKQFDEAFFYQKELENINEKQRDLENDEVLNKLMVSFETEKKEQQIKLQKLTILNQRERNKRILYAGISLISLISLLFGFLYFRNRTKQQMKLQEEEAHYQQKLLLSTVNAQEEERKRIAQDLHDGIGQQISGLKMGYNALLEKTGLNSHPLSSKMGSVIEDLAEDIRTISHSMMPKALSELGIIPALQDMISKSLLGSNMEYTFEHKIDQHTLTTPVSIAIYRISQELINNIIKHAEASRIDLTLMQQKDHLVLIVEDNGNGIEDNRNNGKGLFIIESRLQAVGGKIHFENNEGTIATVRINLTHG